MWVEWASTDRMGMLWMRHTSFVERLRLERVCRVNRMDYTRDYGSRPLSHSHIEIMTSSKGGEKEEATPK